MAQFLLIKDPFASHLFCVLIKKKVGCCFCIGVDNNGLQLCIPVKISLDSYLLGLTCFGRSDWLAQIGECKQERKLLLWLIFLTNKRRLWCFFL